MGTAPTGSTADSPPLPADAPSSVSDEVERLAGRLACEMADRWHRGERPTAQEYLDRHPPLRDRPEAAVRLVYEEVCLRQEVGEPDASAEALRRFPEWRAQLEVLLDCHRLLRPEATTSFPEAGDHFADFRLVAELGRGAAGRVFLATQPSLAGRHVVIKFVARNGREHLSLARLQHTNIVPIYSAVDDPARNLRALCMPFFGGRALSRVLDDLKGRPASRRTGQDLLACVRSGTGTAPAASPAGSPAADYLARVSYEHALCAIGERLAQGLEYAHERGILHLDVKPSNILLAADGQPMLLDFHLAREPVPAGGAAPDWLGGTPRYMAPEQKAALAAVREGRPVPAAVDGRADVYSLGLVLYEALAGGLPDPVPSPLPSLRRFNRQFSPGLAAVVGKCLASEPAARYQRAGLLAADLLRHLADRPLVGVPNRNLLERWRKWRRRRPHALLAAGSLLLIVVALGAVGWAWV